jgi:hypothetical protein
VPKLRHVWPFAIVAGALCIVGARGQNLDEGKTGPQLFALDCAACHRSPQGLAKNYSGWSLTSFLRQHYTSSAGSANVLAAYLTSGANARADQKKQAKQTPARDQAKAGKAEPAAEQPARKQAARPAEPAAEQPGQPGRPARKTRREAAEPVPMPPPEPTSTVPTVTAAAPDSAPDNAPGLLPAGAADVASAAETAAAAPPPQPGFADPLP